MQLQSAAQIPGDVARASEVARVLITYGLAGWLKGTEWDPVRRLLTSHAGEILTDQPFPVRARLALTDLGTTFIKLGQVLGTRPDLVGPDMARELSRLQSGTPADPPEVAIATIEKELGRPIAECFSEFDHVAMASASIGQVHRAKLLNGRSVVVKVQHPGIEGTIRRDLNILSTLASLAERQDDLKRYQPTAVLREFRQTLLRELDFRREMRSLQIFRQNFAADERWRGRSAGAEAYRRRGRRSPGGRGFCADDLPRRLLPCRSAPRKYSRDAQGARGDFGCRDGWPDRR
jgi:ubiquinone biosynthesis protein